MKIILSDLEKHLFPERYPFYNGHFAECKNYLMQTVDETDEGRMNISFIVKLTKMSLSIKNEELRIICNLLFERIVENQYDWQKDYNWQELKLFLMYFIIFSKAKSILEIKHLFKETSTISLFKKYQLRSV
ncbi:MAG: hypothetical protein Q8J88_00160 [Bacteroidales bacterium]|nr:hypothetical protein [Bacteroidales bacterium]